jgi:LacI family transcriptional regulator
VVVDAALPLDDSIPVVGANHWSGARLATEHLIALGHRRIGVITGPEAWNATVDRLAGFRTALANAGLPDPSPDLVREGDFQEAGGYQAAQSLLNRPDRPTAIFGFNDNMAVGALRAARERGLVVPRDLSVVGFDDAHIARLISPPLTTVRQPLREMGRVAASVLSRLLNHEALDATRVELSNRLVVRDSTASPRRLLSSA